MAADRVLEVWDDTISSPRDCNDPACRAKIQWAEVVKTGRKMCFTSPAVPLRTRHDEATGRLIAEMDFAGNHWATCPGAKGFHRGKG